MDKKIVVLVFSEDKKVNLEKISKRFPECIMKEDKYAEIGKRCILLSGPEEEINKIIEELDADVVVPGKEAEESIGFQIIVYPRETYKEVLGIIRDMHDSVIDFCREVETDRR